ncbi:MAG: hypothetical protein RIQ46_1922 [Pseudomonadota bacterium]
MGEARRQTSPQSVTRVIRILEALCASPEPLSLADLSRVLGTPKSSLAALLRGLADEGFVVAADGAWRLGSGAFGLGSALVEARRRRPDADLIREGMRRLAERTGETVLLAVADQGGETMTYVEVIESRNAVRFAVRPGDRRQLFCTAGGRVLLAAAPAEQAQAYLRQLRPEQLAAATVTDRAALAAAIADARTQGVAQTVDQAADGVTGTAAVIRDASGAVPAALVVAAPTSRWQDRRGELRAMVREEAEVISRGLGWR